MLIANWKMNFSLEEAVSIVGKLDSNNLDSLIIAPPIPYLSYLTQISSLKFATQNISLKDGYGSYTGEYSANMIKSCNVDYAIIGHSERRSLFSENNKLAKSKADICIKNKIIPIICIGENLDSRENGNYKEFLLDQIIESVPKDSNAIIAYEPSWAIGTGVTPSIDEITEIFQFISDNKKLSSFTRGAKLIYGGSVSSKNCKDIYSLCDGLLVGSASLKYDELLNIYNNISII